MMFGVVTNNCEAIIKVVVGRIGSPKITVYYGCVRLGNIFTVQTKGNIYDFTTFE